MTNDYLLIFVSEWKSNTSLTKQNNNIIFFYERCFLEYYGVFYKNDELRIVFTYEIPVYLFMCVLLCQ